MLDDVRKNRKWIICIYFTAIIKYFNVFIYLLVSICHTLVLHKTLILQAFLYSKTLQTFKIKLSIRFSVINDTFKKHTKFQHIALYRTPLNTQYSLVDYQDLNGTLIEVEWKINLSPPCDLLPYMEDRSHFALTHYFWRQAACQLVSADAKVTDLGKNMGP